MPEITETPTEKKETKPVIRMANFRVSQNEFRMGKLQQHFARLLASEILWYAQSESDGNISATILYR